LALAPQVLRCGARGRPRGSRAPLLAAPRIIVPVLLVIRLMPHEDCTTVPIYPTSNATYGQDTEYGQLYCVLYCAAALFLDMPVHEQQQHIYRYFAYTLYCTSRSSSAAGHEVPCPHTAVDRDGYRPWTASTRPRDEAARLCLRLAHRSAQRHGDAPTARFPLHLTPTGRQRLGGGALTLRSLLWRPLPRLPALPLLYRVMHPPSFSRPLGSGGAEHCPGPPMVSVPQSLRRRRR